MEQVKRLFRQSGLYDPDKTDRIAGHNQTGKAVTYLEMTIYNALRKRQAQQKNTRLPYSKDQK